VAESAYATAAQLRRDYGVIGGPPSFHNFLVNLGIRKRGLCFQWAEDLLVQLDALKLRTLELHWAEARAGSWQEHNCVVVTAKGQRFREGIILDCWRHSAICSGRRLSLTIIHGSKTVIMPPSCAVNSQRPRSPGLRIYGTQTLGLCAAQVCDLCSIADRASAFTLAGVYERRAGVLKTSAVADRRYSKPAARGRLLRFNSFSVSAGSLRFFA
jgi:hypothetical protein